MTPFDPAEPDAEALKSGRLDPSRPILIQGAKLITMDDLLGDLVGDVLVRDGKIAQVGRNLVCEGAVVIDGIDKVVIPGFVNSHIHLWQTTIKGCGGDYAFGDYLQYILGEAGKHYRPEDVYVATLLGAIEQIEAGVTTVYDWAHILNTPEHADAAIDALQASGVRAVFGHGTPGDDVARWYYQSRETHPQDIVRLRRTRLASDDTLVTLALSMRGPDFAVEDVNRGDIELARSLGIMASMHLAVGMYGDYVPHARRLGEAGLLGPDINLTHCNRLLDEEIAMAVDLGCSISVTPEVEMQMGHGVPVTGRVQAAGGRIALGTDVVSSLSADMFSQMRFAVQSQRMLANAEAHAGGGMLERLPLGARDILASATIEGARALGLDGRIGSITPGKDADLTILSWAHERSSPLVNPVQAVVFHAGVANVHTVMVAGSVRKYDHALTGPEPAGVGKAAEMGRRIMSAAGIISPEARAA
ncbi:MAG TPA: amidohydrolase family protein [Caulobacteraceae bacterium]|jgi:cytosine/adenosine deaminase-related metal-dependent hydrolase